MKYFVKIGDRTFEVQILDLDSRPVKTLVDGTPIEVWPETPLADQPDAAINFVVAQSTKPADKEHPANQTGALYPPHLADRARPIGHAPERGPLTAPSGSAAPNGSSSYAIHAPIPGVILSVAVQPGNQVTAGQVLCVLEAMKMKNPIKAPRSGLITAVNVTPGQAVKHKDVLFEYST
jgi:biotin carboxyl carrier protein